MLFNENWLRERVDPRINAGKLAETLTLAGLEVEAVMPVTSLDLSPSNRGKLVVGRIASIEPHPDAGRLRLCDVDIGTGKPLKIVCGAPNASAGLVAPVAMVGATLPGGTIRRSAIRGVTSEGMLCSAAELGLAEQSSGLMSLDADASLGTPVADYLGLDDRVFELNLTPNRGDCLGITGIAREVSVLTGTPMRDLSRERARAAHGETVGITLDAPQHCARFAGRIVRDIDMQARTPDWMREKLRRAGLRPINPVVDITNYVMLETGQPMHGYDLEKLDGDIVVRMARKGERLKLLDGNTIRLRKDNLVIADQRKAVGLAGIMGGDNTAISDQTRHIFFEAAFFSPRHIIGKARRLGMHTDASHRFERGVDPTGQVGAVELATRLLLEISGGKPGKTCHAVDRRGLPSPPTILLERGEIPRMLGVRVPAARVVRILESLGMRVKAEKTGWRVTPPAWRFDITGQHDLVEEVGRCYGFDRVAPKMPVSISREGAQPESVISQGRIRRILTARGYHEAIHYSFVDPGLQRQLLETSAGVRLTNPLAESMSEMRQSLLPGLLQGVQRNLNRQESRVRLFEIGNIFLRSGKKRSECGRIAAVAAGSANPRNWSEPARNVDFFDVKGDMEELLLLAGLDGIACYEAAQHPLLHPGQSARILIEGREAGWIGGVHPLKRKLLDLEGSVYLFELDLSILGEAPMPQFRALSRYPAVQRDLSVVVDRGVSADNVLELVRNSAGGLLKSLELFDIYTGERVEKNKKSFAFSLTFQSESSNLTSGEIDAVTAEIITTLQQSVGAELRN